MKKVLLILAGLALVCGILALLFLGPLPWKRTHYQGRTVKAWMLQLYSPSEPAREQARSALKAMGREAVPELVGLLRAKEAPFGDKLRSSSGRLPKPVVSVLLRFLPSPPAVVCRKGAARALAVIGPDAAAAAKPLAQRMRDADPAVANEAALALTRVRPDCAPQLAAALRDKRPNARRAAALAAVELGPAAEAIAPELVQRVVDEDPVVRATARGSLWRIGAPVIPALIATALHGGGGEQKAATNLLSRFYAFPNLARPASRLVELKHDAAELQSKRAGAMRELGESARSNPGLQRLLAAATRDPSSKVRLAAIESLGSSPGPMVVITLISRLQDDSGEVRAAAARALGNLGASGRPALGGLKRLAQDEQESVRLAAGKAVAQIQE